MSAKSRRKSVGRTNAERRFDASKPIEPVVITSEAPEAEPIHIFTIDDVEYFMPGYIGPNIALQVLEKIELDGEEAGLSFMLWKVLGEKAHHALKTCEGMTSAQLEAVSEIVLTRVMGAMDTGN